MSYTERKRILDREIAAMARMILKDQKILIRTEAIRLAPSLHDQKKTYTPINSTIEDTIENSAENITEDTELNIHVTQGPHTVEPSNSRVANLQNAVQTSSNQPTKTVTQNQPNQLVQKATSYPALDVPENPTRNTVRRPYNVHGVELTDEQRIEARH